MNTQSPNQWLDSRNLFDYCFDNFQLFNIAENETNYTSAEQKNAGTLNTNEPFVDIDKDAGIVLPKTAEFSDATSKIVYDDVTNDTVGTIEYTYAGHEVGKADIVKTRNRACFKNTDQDEYDHNRGGCSSCLTCSWDYYKESCR